MPPIPYQLLAVQKDIAAGKRRWAKVKTLLSWFGQKGRGKHVVETIKTPWTKPVCSPARSSRRWRTPLHRVQGVDRDR